jgi:hypothetical protein
MNSVFTQSRTQGIQSTWEGDNTRFISSFNDGIRTANTDYTSRTEADWGVTGRLEYKWAGDWKQYDEFTSFPNAAYFGAVSGALHYQSASNTVNTPDLKIFEWVLDVMVKGNGWNLYSAYVGRSTDTTTTLYDQGIMIQGGYFIRPKWELFARFDAVLPDKDNVNHSSMDTITVGANKYISQDSHAVKLTMDFEYFIGKQSAGIAPASTLTGLLASSQYDQWAVQAQLQLMF